MNKETHTKEIKKMNTYTCRALKRGLLVVACNTARSARILLTKLGEGVLEAAKVWFGHRKEA